MTPKQSAEDEHRHTIEEIENKTVVQVARTRVLFSIALVVILCSFAFSFWAVYTAGKERDERRAQLNTLACAVGQDAEQVLVAITLRPANAGDPLLVTSKEKVVAAAKQVAPNCPLAPQP